MQIEQRRAIAADGELRFFAGDVQELRGGLGHGEIFSRKGAEAQRGTSQAGTMQNEEPEELKALWRKAIGSLVRMPLFMGVMIFVPAWSLNYWEAWLYLGLFSASVTGMTLYLLRYDRALIA